MKMSEQKTFTLSKIIKNIYGVKKGIHDFGSVAGKVVMKAYKESYPDVELLPRTKEFFNGKSGVYFWAVQYPEHFKDDATQIIASCYSEYRRTQNTKDITVVKTENPKETTPEKPAPRKRKRIKKSNYEPVKK